MNTPQPCDTCGNLYVNALCEDDPTYCAECMSEEKDWVWGGECPHYIHYEKGGWTHKGKKPKFNLVSTDTGRFSSKHSNISNKPKAIPTHVGNLVGGVLAKRVEATVALFKGKGCWVDPKGSRYSTKTGYQVDNDWGLLRLDLDSVQKLEE